MHVVDLSSKNRNGNNTRVWLSKEITFGAGAKHYAPVHSTEILAQNIKKQCRNSKQHYVKNSSMSLHTEIKLATSYSRYYYSFITRVPVLFM